MKATKLPSGNYRCRVYVGKDSTGKKIWKSITGPNKKRVELEASKFSVEQQSAAPRTTRQHFAALASPTTHSMH